MLAKSLRMTSVGTQFGQAFPNIRPPSGIHTPPVAAVSGAQRCVGVGTGCGSFVVVGVSLLADPTLDFAPPLEKGTGPHPLFAEPSLGDAWAQESGMFILLVVSSRVLE